MDNAMLMAQIVAFPVFWALLFFSLYQAWQREDNATIRLLLMLVLLRVMA